MSNDTGLEITPAPGKWVIFTLGGIFGETKRALRVVEPGREPVIYVPREDMAMAFFDKTDHTTHCPKKGDATYYSLDTKSRTLENAAWSYEDPLPAAKQIKGYLAFYPELVTVEKQGPA